MKDRVQWADEAEAMLLELWQDNIEGLRGVHRNGHIYAKMAEELKNIGHAFDAKEVKIKIHNLTARYR